MATYSAFGAFMELFNPYARETELLDPSSPATGTIVITAGDREMAGRAFGGTLISIPGPLRWPFRLPLDIKNKPGANPEWIWQRPVEPGPVTWPGGGPGHMDKILEVESCEIVKAIVFPYYYTRVLGRPHPPDPNQTVKMKAHLVIGYTGLRSIPDNPFPVGTQPVAHQPIAGVSYARLGEFIQEQHPIETGELYPGDGDAQPTALNVSFDFDNLSPPPFIMNAICWLMDKSLYADNLGYVYAFGSSADDEMDILQKDACLTWPVPQPNWVKVDPHDTRTWRHDPETVWMRNYQITKALRVMYILQNNQVPNLLGGDILIGYSGSGDY